MGGLGLHMQSDVVSDVAFVASAGQAERNQKGRPAALCLLQGACVAFVRECWSSLHERYPEESKWYSCYDLHTVSHDCMGMSMAVL